MIVVSGRKPADTLVPGELSEEDELSESPLVSAIREMGAGFREELAQLRMEIRSDRKWDRLFLFAVVAIALALAWRSSLAVRTPAGSFEMSPSHSAVATKPEDFLGEE